MPRRDSNPQTYATDSAATGICQRICTTSKLMEVDPSVSKNSILDVSSLTTTYITKKRQIDEFMTRTCQENICIVVSTAATTLLMLYL